MSKDYAKKHSMDISHVASVELPLIVKNPDKAIAMLGGTDRIKRTLNSQYRVQSPQGSSHSVDDRNLELRLRNDPFHHPVQASFNRHEKILIKVSIPKSSLPDDYYDSPHKYTIRELIKRNNDNNGPNHKVEPVAIINKNYNFRGMADFQMSTKNNKTVQAFNDNIINMNRFEDLKEFYKSTLITLDEFKKLGNYENKDHHLIPPPNFSGVRFPFDFKYQKNPSTVTIRDSNGVAKVVMKTDTKKLFPNTVDVHSDTVPDKPLPEIVTKYQWLLSADLSNEYADKKLYDCIVHLTLMFEAKPIWLRQPLVAATPEHLRTAVKEALPYISYCYKNGPWRFCNVKLGVNPKLDPSFWIYQSEYFRIPGLRKGNVRTDVQIVPNTVKIASGRTDVKVSEDLFFTGVKLPKAINYQIGDFLDADVQAYIKQAQEKDGQFFRDSVDLQDGWVKKQVLETIRRIVRYKLVLLRNEEPIDSEKVAKIIATDYTEKDVEENENGNEDEDDDEDDNEDENDMDQEDADEEDTTTSVNGENILHRIKEVDPHTASKINELVDIIRQDTLEQE